MSRPRSKEQNVSETQQLQQQLQVSRQEGDVELQCSEKPRAVAEKWWGWAAALGLSNTARRGSLEGSRVFPEAPE